jgi:hypothetical protein
MLLLFFSRAPVSRLQSTDLEADFHQSTTSPVVASVSPFNTRSQSDFSLSSRTDSGFDNESHIDGPEAESLSLSSLLEDSSEQECLNSDNVNSDSTVQREELNTAVIERPGMVFYRPVR